MSNPEHNEQYIIRIKLSTDKRSFKGRQQLWTSDEEAKPHVKAVYFSRPLIINPLLRKFKPI